MPNFPFRLLQYPIPPFSCLLLLYANAIPGLFVCGSFLELHVLILVYVIV
jgi:hypothetical protein